IAAEIVIARIRRVLLLPLIMLRRTQLVPQAVMLLPLLRELLELREAVILELRRMTPIIRLSSRRILLLLLIGVLLVSVQIALKLRREWNGRRSGLIALLRSKKRRMLDWRARVRLLAPILLRIMIGRVRRF